MITVASDSPSASTQRSNLPPERLRPVPPWLSDGLRRRLDHEEQAIFGMLLAGITPDQIAQTLNISAAGLESRLWATLRKLEAPQGGARSRAGHGQTSVGT